VRLGRVIGWVVGGPQSVGGTWRQRNQCHSGAQYGIGENRRRHGGRRPRGTEATERHVASPRTGTDAHAAAPNSDTGANPDANANPNPNPDANPDANPNPDADADANTDANTDANANPDPNANANANADAGSATPSGHR
jgi:hypothetical protein